jgi:hypothetical protein
LAASRRPAAAGRALRALAVLAVSAPLAGCGLGAGAAPTAVKLTVTREFGASLVRSFSRPEVQGAETVMSLLMRNATVSTRYGGGFVQSIDGTSGGTAGGEPVAWFYYVNGIQAPKGAAETNVHPGDHIWWDWHDWSQAESVPAVVGSFPEPFLNGIAGKRYPVRVECANITEEACKIVVERLRALDVPAAIAAFGSGAEPQTLRVAVGPWKVVGEEPITHTIDAGPGKSGVYARFSRDAHTLTLLDADGGTTRSFGPGAGLVAATTSGEYAPVWVVTGTDPAGVRRAAEAFDARDLDDRFAAVLGPEGAVFSAPAGATSAKGG